MFEFSNDFDEELEDFLNVPLDEKFIRNANDNASVCEHKEPSLDAFDDDELILSVVEDIDMPVPEESNPVNGELSDRRVSEPLREKFLQTTAITSRERKITTFFTNSNTVPSSSITKHKIIVPNESPSTPKAARVEYERKFPGPAGLIARKSRDYLSSGNEGLNGGTSKQQLDISITDESLFENSPWQQLQDDVNSKSYELLKIISEFSVAAVKRMNIVKHTSRKIPLFAAVLFHLDSSVPDPSVILKDPSGEIRGTLHKDIWEQYSHLLSVGSALLLRQVSVLSIANSRKLYLNITGNNIDSIYTVRTGKPVLVTRVSPAPVLDYLSENTSSDNSKKFTNFTSNESSKTDESGVQHPIGELSSVCYRKIQKSETTPPKYPQKSHSTPVLGNAPLSSNKTEIKSTSNTECLPGSIPNKSSTKTEIKSTSNIECSPGSISNELDGIDADSIFGDF